MLQLVQQHLFLLRRFRLLLRHLGEPAMRLEAVDCRRQQVGIALQEVGIVLGEAAGLLNSKRPGGATASRRMLVQSVQQQKAALAEFGIEAFRTDDLDALLTKAAMLAGQGLGVKRAKVLELLPSGDHLLIRAGVGWEPDVVGNATIDADRASPAGYALLTGEPVISEDLENDKRFCCPEVLGRHGIRSAVNVIIRGNNGPFGVARGR